MRLQCHISGEVAVQVCCTQRSPQLLTSWHSAELDKLARSQVGQLNLVYPKCFCVLDWMQYFSSSFLALNCWVLTCEQTSIPTVTTLQWGMMWNLVHSLRWKVNRNRIRFMGLYGPQGSPGPTPCMNAGMLLLNHPWLILIQTLLEPQTSSAEDVTVPYHCLRYGCEQAGHEIIHFQRSWIFLFKQAKCQWLLTTLSLSTIFWYSIPCKM